MTYQFELRERQPQPTLVIRTRSSVQDMPQVLGQAWGAVMQYAGQAGHQPSGAPFVAYHNMDMQDLDLEIGFAFAQKLNGEGEVLAGEIPGGKAAGCVHVGPYDQLPATYSALMKWMEANGHTPCGAAYESYLNDPHNTPPEELQTDIFFPLL